jgi:nucleotide-binding universal stress UspA family protein
VARTILIAVEPDTGGRVASIGLELARTLNARLVLAYVQRDPPLHRSLADRERARRAGKRQGRQVLDGWSAAFPPDVDVEKRIEHGGVVSKLGDVANDVGAALIVVGPCRRGPVASALFGSISQKLAREAPCPVMIVPESPAGSRRSFEGATDERATIVVGTDGSPSSSAATRFARGLADGLDHRLVVIQLRDRGGSRVDALQAMAASEDARMIVIAANHRAGRGLRLGRSLAAALPRLARCPVIVVSSRATTTLGDVRETAHGAAPQSATGG